MAGVKKIVPGRFSRQNTEKPVISTGERPAAGMAEVGTKNGQKGNADSRISTSDMKFAVIWMFQNDAAAILL